MIEKVDQQKIEQASYKFELAQCEGRYMHEQISLKKTHTLTRAYRDNRQICTYECVYVCYCIIYLCIALSRFFVSAYQPALFSEHRFYSPLAKLSSLQAITYAHKCISYKLAISMQGCVYAFIIANKTCFTYDYFLFFFFSLAELSKFHLSSQMHIYHDEDFAQTQAFDLFFFVYVNLIFCKMFLNRFIYLIRIRFKRL